MEDDEDEEFDQEQIIQAILALGNEIWRNFGQEEEIDDVRVFFQHTFYIQCFQMAYPSFDFSQLLSGENDESEEKMAQCIQALVDLLAEEILQYDMSHISGEEIISGNPEHCINLLQILQQISSASMLQDDDDEEEEGEAENDLPVAQQKQQSASQNKKADGTTQEEQKNMRMSVFPSSDNKKELDDNNLFSDTDDLKEKQQQFLDVLVDWQKEEEDDEQQEDKVGDVIGNIGNELDIEFDDEIRENIQNRQGRGTSSAENGGHSSEKPGVDDEEEEMSEMVDHNDVNIIDDEMEEDEEDEQDEDEDRQLNRQTGNVNFHQVYGDEEDEEEELHSSRQDAQLIQDRMKYNQDSRQIIDDQNLIIGQMEGEEEEEEDDDGQQDGDYEGIDFDNIDPELLEAAQKLGLDEEGILALQRQMYEQQNAEEQEEEYAEELDDEENLQQMMKNDNNAMQIHDQQHDDDEDEEEDQAQILRGGQNIEDEVYNEEEDQHEDLRHLDSEMAQQLKKLNEQEDDNEDDEQEDDIGEGEGEDEEDQLIDIENLNDQEKAILMQYLHEEYQKNPDSLPMPKEVVEQFLAENQDMLMNLQQQQDDEEDLGEEQEELDDENDMINKGAMVIKGEQDDEEELEDEQLEGAYTNGIQGGEQNIIDEEGDGDGDEEEYQGEGEDIDEDMQIIQNQMQYNPQYQLEEIQEVDQDGNLIQNNINLAQQQHMQQMMYFQQQQQQMHDQMNFVPIATKKVKKKKTQQTMQSLRRPPLPGTQRPLTAAANKKFKRAKIGGIHTISHDEEHHMVNRRFEGFNSGVRKTNSQKRPNTAKTRKPLNSQVTGVGSRKKVNNFMGSKMASTPSHRIKSGAPGIRSSVRAIGLVPQQSQMFTSFGMPQQHAASLSQRKGAGSLGKKKTSSGIFGKKKMRNSFQHMSKSGGKSKKALMQQQFYQQQAFQSAGLPQNDQPQMLNIGAPGQNLVEMPILSEEFLNQLNEEQLQSLLEQQQQLMMLQQQQQQQNFDENGNPIVSQEQFEEEEVPEQDEVEEELDEEQQQQLVMDEMAAIQQLQQQQEQQQQQQQFNQFAQNQMALNSMQRNRGRSKAYTQGSRTGGSGARGPSGNKAGSGSRHADTGRTGSKKRSQKTRSSLNVAGGAQLNLVGNMGLGPQSLAVLPSNISKQKKMTAQIYGSGNMLSSLISQRKKSSSQTKKTGKGKRSQPNQGGAMSKSHKIMLQQRQQQMLGDWNQQQQYLMQQQQIDQQTDAIDEVSPDQEEGESQNQFQNQRQMQSIPGAQLSNIADDLSTEQIIELLQNAADAQNSQNAELGETNFDENGDPIIQQQLPEEIQIQLQQVLQERMMQQQQQEQQQFLLQQQRRSEQSPEGNFRNRVQQQNQNICNILTQSVSKAKERYAHMGPGVANSASRKSATGSPERKLKNIFGAAEMAGVKADQRIVRQKKQFENLLKQYKLDKRLRDNKRQQDIKRAEKTAMREDKINAIKQRKFEEEMIYQQRSQMFKRNAKEARLCKKVYKLASDLEKNKLLEEKKQYKESEMKKIHQKKAMVDTIENYYKDKINMLKDRIDNEKFERKVAQEAQKKALSQMKKELDEQKRLELQRYIQLLKQEDEKFDLQTLNIGKLEDEIIKLYKK